MTPDETLAPPMYAGSTENPMASSVKILGIFFAVFSVLYFLVFLFFMVSMGASGVAASHQVAPEGSRAAGQSQAQIVAMSLAFGGLFSGIFGVCGIITLLAAIGLLGRKAWGRTASIVASILLLISFPFGTCLGIADLVVMLRSGAKKNYLRLIAGV